MEFDELRESWQKLGATDPRWAILSEPGRKDGGWGDEAFWRSGEDTANWLSHHLGTINALPPLGRALDFGCGIGRLTQALARNFAEVVGVDVAESMLAGARAANRHGERVRYVHNPRPDLSVFADASFDFVLTLIVLQHMRQDYSAAYLREFLRVLRSGGILFFQIPIEPLGGVATRSGPSTAAATPVPPFSLNAFTAVLPPQRDMAEGERQWFRVEVYNPGPQHMHAQGPGAVELGTRFDRVDACAATPMLWTSLPHDLAPGERLAVVVAARAPTHPGPYTLAALPCVGRKWCSHPGNVPATGRVVVGPAAPGRVLPDEPPPKPVFAVPDGTSLIEVYGTSLTDLHANVTAAGGEFVDVCLDGWAGYEWVSAHCVVRKR